MGRLAAPDGVGAAEQFRAYQTTCSDSLSRKHRTMKSLSVTIAAVSILALLVLTNPTMEAYTAFLHSSILKETRRETSEVDRVVGALLGGIASTFVASQTVRTDYVLFSTYDMQIENERLRALGLLKNFIILESPNTKQAK
jgi:Domain of unknown function (DUF4359)